MKVILVITLLSLTTSLSAARNEDCGPIRSISIVGDHDTDWVAGLSIKAKTWMRMTKDNSPKVIEAFENVLLEDNFFDGDDDDLKGFFMCLDEYETYYDYRHKYASVTKFRVWKNGKRLY